MILSSDINFSICLKVSKSIYCAKRRVGYCLIGGSKKSKVWGFSKQGSAEAAYTQNPTSETRKFDFEPSQAALSPIL